MQQKGAKLCTTLKAKSKKKTKNCRLPTPVALLQYGQQSVFRRPTHSHTHSGDFVGPLAQSDFPVQHVSTLTRTVWPLYVWLQHCGDTCMQRVVTLDCILYIEMCRPSFSIVRSQKREFSEMSAAGVRKNHHKRFVEVASREKCRFLLLQLMRLCLRCLFANCITSLQNDKLHADALQVF